MKYNDKVRVIKGFYEGLEGIMIDKGFGLSGYRCFKKYLVLLNIKDTITNCDISRWISENYLEKI